MPAGMVEHSADEPGADDMYCFRCNDRETGVSDVFVHIDILWDDFAAKLERRFQRPVYVVYRREGEDMDRAVQSEADFEDMCEYLDDTQLQSLPVEVRTLRQKREMRRMVGDGPLDGGGLSASYSQESPRDVLGAFGGGSVPRDRLVSAKPGHGKQIRPATAGARQQSASARPRQQKYGALQKPKSAWEGAVREDKVASPRNRRAVKNTMGGFDKESMQDRITALQRQLTDMAEDRKQLLAESMRLQKELSKVLTENEELFKAKGGNLYMKVGASSKQVHVMKERIKSLEAEKAAVQKDMAKLKADSKVTRLAELEVEKGTYLHEVRRLQQENRKQQEELQDIHARTESQAANAEEGDMNYNKMFDMYMERGRQLDEAKRKMRDMQVKTQEAEEDKRQAETERNKLTQQLQRVRQTSAKAEGGGVQRGVPRDWKDKEEALQKEIRELKQVQKRLDLALARANRERDTAEMERADKEADLKKLSEQKRALQMQLHSLGAGAGRRPGDAHKIADRSDMICFFCRELERNHVEVQFVDFRVKYADFCDILQRLYGRPTAVAFSYLLHGEEVVVRSEEDFTRCKEVIEDSYCGHGDQAMVVTVVDQHAAGSGALDSSALSAGRGHPDGGSAVAARAAPAGEASGMMALDTTGGDNLGQAARAGPPSPAAAPQRLVDFTFACYEDGDTHLGDITITDCSPWAEMCDKLQQVAGGHEACFTFPDPDQAERRVDVTNPDQWSRCLDQFRKHRDDLQDKILEIDIVRKAKAPGAAAPEHKPVAIVAAPEPEEDQPYEDEFEQDEPRVASARREAPTEDGGDAEKAASVAAKEPGGGALSGSKLGETEMSKPAAGGDEEDRKAAAEREAELAAAARAAAAEAEAAAATVKAKEAAEAEERRRAAQAASDAENAERRRREEEEADARKKARLEQQRLEEAAAQAREEEAAARRQREADELAERRRQEAAAEEERARAAAAAAAAQDEAKAPSPPAEDYGDDFDEDAAEEEAEVDDDGAAAAARARSHEDAEAGVVDDYGDDDFNDEVPVDEDDWAGGGGDLIADDDCDDPFEDDGPPDGGGFEAGEVSDDEF